MFTGFILSLVLAFCCVILSFSCSNSSNTSSSGVYFNFNSVILCLVLRYIPWAFPLRRYIMEVWCVGARLAPAQRASLSATGAPPRHSGLPRLNADDTPLHMHVPSVSIIASWIKEWLQRYSWLERLSIPVKYSKLGNRRCSHKK